METLSAILAVDDECLRRHLTAVFRKNGVTVSAGFSSGKETLEHAHQRSFQILYADLELPDMHGVELVKRVKVLLPTVNPLMGSDRGTAQDVIVAMQAGVTDFIIDPFEPELVQNAIQRATQKIFKLRSSRPTQRSNSTKSFITQDKVMLGVLDMARKVAPSVATILITGESGTGKELLAAFIHANSRRQDEPFVAINCAALPEQLAESELFGHEKGAFTGAIARKIGLFESAGKGSLVLDEITEMALPLQAKLLRALQEKEIVRLGGNRSISTDARVLAISNRNMKKTVESGAFREDLFYRLNVIPLTIPPLRERKNDIPLLADYFLNRFCKQNSTTIQHISDRAMAHLVEQPWPGNVRELENAIQRGVLIGSGRELLPEHLILDETVSAPSRSPSITAGMTVREMEKELIFKTLDAVDDNRTHAAKMLGISIRTLRNKLNDYRGDIQATGA